MTIRALQAGALGLAVLGLVWLWWFCHALARPQLKIGQRQATDDFAYVRVQGQAKRAPSYDAIRLFELLDRGRDGRDVGQRVPRHRRQQLVESESMPFIGDQFDCGRALRDAPG